MTTKDKAEELVEKFMQIIWDSGCTVSKPMVISVAIIAVEEILNMSYFTHSPSEDDDLYKNYWEQVRKELEAM